MDSTPKDKSRPKTKPTGKKQQQEPEQNRDMKKKSSGQGWRAQPKDAAVASQYSSAGAGGGGTAAKSEQLGSSEKSSGHNAGTRWRPGSGANAKKPEYKAKPPSLFKNYSKEEPERGSAGLRVSAPFFKKQDTSTATIHLDPSQHDWLLRLSATGALDANEIVSTLMSKGLKQKNEVISLLQSMITDLSLKNDELYEANYAVLNAQSSFDMKVVNTLDPLLAQIINQSLDSILRLKRDFLRGLSQYQIDGLCGIILKTLFDQATRVNQLYVAMTEKLKEQGEKLDPRSAGGAEGLIAARTESDETYREFCLRFLGQCCFENSTTVSETIIQQVYQISSSIAFLPQSVYSSQKTKQSSTSLKNVNSLFYKTLRAAFNCIANLITQQKSMFIQQNNETIFKHLKNEFDYMMNKIHLYHRSKRFVSQMTTVMRALQFSMNQSPFATEVLGGAKQQPGMAATAQAKKKPLWPKGADKAAQSTGEIMLADNDAIVLFICFYKLMFLGTKFSQKMLKLQLEKEGSGAQRKIVIEDKHLTDEEGKMSDGAVMNDMSDVISSDFGPENYKVHEGTVLQHDGDPDPYQKIKKHANLALRNLLKNNSKILFNYWYILFPSFMMKTQSEFSHFLFDFENKNTQKQFKEKVFQMIEVQEPNLFYVIRQPNAQSHFKSSIYSTFQVLLEHSIIAQQQLPLEREDQPKKQTQSFFSMTEVLGQFIRFLHYILICFLQEETARAHLYPTNPQFSGKDRPRSAASPAAPKVEEYFDRQTFVHIVKAIQSLIHKTPYHLMRKGLCSIMVEALVGNLAALDKVNNRDQLIRNEICAAINQALAKTDLIGELQQNLFNNAKTSEILFNTMFKVHNFISNDKIQILSTLGKNYPEVLTSKWLDTSKGAPKIQLFLQQTIEKIERKKSSQVLKIIEDWLKNYQSLNLADNNDEKVLADSHDSPSFQSLQTHSPYANPIFSKFLQNLIETNLLEQSLTEESSFFSGQKQMTQKVLAIEINTTIAFFNIICIMNQEQYQQIFTTNEQTLRLMSILSDIFYIQDRENVSVPSVLKAAVIKTFGYLIQHQKGASIFTNSKYVCNTILEICLSPQVLSDTNINVYIRNSWTLSFICNLYPIEDIISSQFKNIKKVDDVSNLQRLIDTCIKYAELQASNKEKVAASSVRALGFIVQNLMILDQRAQADEDAAEAKKDCANSGQLALSSEDIRGYIEQIISMIVSKLHNHKNCTPKVIWNLCVAFSKILDTFNQIHNIDDTQKYTDIDYQKTYLGAVFCFESTKCFLSIFMDGQNYKTKIHACQTLLKYVNLNQFGFLDDNRNPENLLKLIWTHIQEQLKFQINFDKMPTASANISSTQEQIAYFEQIHKSFIDFWAHICNLTRINLSSPGTEDGETAAGSQHQSIMVEYFNQNAFDLLQSIILYLRRQLKVPEYTLIFEASEEFKKEDFEKETEQLFEDQPALLPKLEKMQKQIICRIFDIIDMEGSEVRVSLLVYSSFKKLAMADVRTEYRLLEMLRAGKSSFDPVQN